jgi:import inner membrane translocase subunit TIM9
MQNSQLEQAIADFQIKDSIRTFNSLTERCFNVCATNFKIRRLDQEEEECMHRCTDKFLRHAARVGKVVAEQSMLQQAGPSPIPQMK